MRSNIIQPVDPLRGFRASSETIPGACLGTVLAEGCGEPQGLYRAVLARYPKVIQGQFQATCTPWVLLLRTTASFREVACGDFISGQCIKLLGPKL